MTGKRAAFHAVAHEVTDRKGWLDMGLRIEQEGCVCLSQLAVKWQVRQRADASLHPLAETRNRYIVHGGWHPAPDCLVNRRGRAVRLTSPGARLVSS